MQGPFGVMNFFSRPLSLPKNQISHASKQRQRRAASKFDLPGVDTQEFLVRPNSATAHDSLSHRGPPRPITMPKRRPSTSPQPYNTLDIQADYIRQAAGRPPSPKAQTRSDPSAKYAAGPILPQHGKRYICLYIFAPHCPAHASQIHGLHHDEIWPPRLPNYPVFITACREPELVPIPALPP